MRSFDKFESPGLIVYPDRVKRNIAKIIEMVEGNPTRLRPHIKTHKTKTFLNDGCLIVYIDIINTKKHF